MRYSGVKKNNKNFPFKKKKKLRKTRIRENLPHFQTIKNVPKNSAKYFLNIIYFFMNAQKAKSCVVEKGVSCVWQIQSNLLK